MFATLCSKPDAMNNQIGKKMARTFPAISLAVEAIHTAIQTSQLHNIPMKKAFSKLRPVL
jgi:hypothetical protein